LKEVAVYHYEKKERKQKNPKSTNPTTREIFS